ncbi:MAG: hypothetical protein ACHQT8_01835 [Chlamydiales bacterium]
MKLSHTAAVIFSGVLWLIIGLFLLMKGLNLVVLAAHAEQFGIRAVLISRLAAWSGSHQSGALILIAFGLLIGLIKGRFVLVKTVKKVVARIVSLPAPIKVTELFSARYLLLMAIMVGLGISLRFAKLPADLHGLIDVAIGSALVNGSMIYFRLALLARTS